MKSMRSFAAGVAGAVLLGAGSAAMAADGDAPRTFCNPLNLDYGWGGKGHRHGADPVIVLFKDRYYLFSTYDVPGFRVSDDLIAWTSVAFPADVASLAMTHEGGYCAPAVAVCGDRLYFINMIPRKGETNSAIMRTADPMSGRWERCGTIRRVGDPALFFDDDGRAWLYHGLGKPTKVFELDTNTWTEIAGSERELRPAAATVADYAGGYERGRREIFGETDTGAWFGRFATMPCQEAAWMTRRGGRYYLQYSTPGTVSQWYCDTVLEGDAPTGPFRAVDYAPVSLKAGGFVGSAGHSCVFRDRHGNWWRATTMWIGVHDLFERRLGLFRVGFDAAGRMFTSTALGDLPQVMPDGPCGPDAPYLAGWWVQSEGAAASASSALPDHPPALAADEDIRTWWSAAGAGPDEWFALDLGRSRRVQAVQVNFAEQDCHVLPPMSPGDAHRYRLLGSEDGHAWKVLADRSANTRAVPHDYHAFPQAVSVRHLKVEHVAMPAGGKFALRDLRVFGPGEGKPPAPVGGARLRRDAADDRNATISWTPAAGAQGYLVRIGAAPERLWTCIQVRGGGVSNLATHVLTRGVPATVRVDAFNDSGVTPGSAGE